MNKAIIIIPIYKNSPDEFETISFLQCLKVLHRYKICVVTYDSLDVSYYKNELQNAGVDFAFEFFDKEYFNDIAGYNRLMLSLDFYKRFTQYEYMLIYQLDAYVFRDELEEWCNKGYDYIGAPWFEGFQTYEKGCKLWKVGNGGFSLRKVQKFVTVLSSILPVFKPRRLLRERFSNKLNSLSDFIRFGLYLIGYKNNIPYYLQLNDSNEDYFYSVFLANTWLKFYIPDILTAANFSFENSPDYLFSLTGKLPFGAHAIEKNRYKEFWMKYLI